MDCLDSDINVFLSRFGCSRCPRKFAVVTAFNRHYCNATLKCICGCSTLFSAHDFEKHSITHLNQMGDYCLLCNQSVYTVSVVFFSFKKKLTCKTANVSLHSGFAKVQCLVLHALKCWLKLLSCLHSQPKDQLVDIVCIYSRRTSLLIK